MVRRGSAQASSLVNREMVHLTIGHEPIALDSSLLKAMSSRLHQLSPIFGLSKN